MFDAITVLNQLARANNGPNRLKAMIGAKNFTRSDEKQQVTFKFMKGANKANYIRITLNSNDLYDVEFIRIWGTKITIISNTENLYCDDLFSHFQNETNLALSL